MNHPPPTLLKKPLSLRIYKMLTDFLFFITFYFPITYKMPESEELTDILLKGCSLVVGVPRKQMWTNWPMQPGQNRSFYSYRNDTKAVLKLA